MRRVREARGHSGESCSSHLLTSQEIAPESALACCFLPFNDGFPWFLASIPLLTTIKRVTVTYSVSDSPSFGFAGIVSKCNHDPSMPHQIRVPGSAGALFAGDDLEPVVVDLRASLCCGFHEDRADDGLHDGAPFIG